MKPQRPLFTLLAALVGSISLAASRIFFSDAMLSPVRCRE